MNREVIAGPFLISKTRNNVGAPLGGDIMMLEETLPRVHGRVPCNAVNYAASFLVTSPFAA